MFGINRYVYMLYMPICLYTKRLTFESTQNQNSHFGVPKQRFETFVINHYAGSVAYTTNDFCEKNKDTLSVDVVQMMQKSKVQFLQMSALYERWGAGVEYHFQEFNEPYAPS